MIDDEEFIRGNVPMTKREVRALTLAEARLDSDSIVVDVGAGTGSITVEAALIAKRGKVLAIERKAEAVKLIKLNVEKFSVANVEVICAEAPQGLQDLPEVDAVIIGGSGGNTDRILDVLNTKLKVGGRIVVNAITIQTSAGALEYFRRHNWNYEAFQVQITRLKKIRAYDMGQALNPFGLSRHRNLKEECLCS